MIKFFKKYFMIGHKPALILTILFLIIGIK